MEASGDEPLPGHGDQWGIKTDEIQPDEGSSPGRLGLTPGGMTLAHYRNTHILFLVPKPTPGKKPS
jgi:hypothetical protein